LPLTSIEAIDLDTLRNTFTRPIDSPDDPGYDAARAPWNLAVDQRPVLVAQARTADDIGAVVRFAAGRGLRVAVQGVGHGAARVGPLEHSVLLRTDLLRDVRVDPERGMARVEAGALWSDLLDATSPTGLAALGGSAPDIGVVAFALGGGIGWLSRAYGLCCHSVTAIELVTPAMGPIRCDDTQHPELFWALRGGGGDLGVVTAIELSLVPTPDLYGGSMLWPWERAAEVLHGWRRWTATVPETVTTAARLLQVPAFPDIPAPMRGRPAVGRVATPRRRVAPRAARCAQPPGRRIPPVRGGHADWVRRTRDRRRGPRPRPRRCRTVGDRRGIPELRRRARPDGTLVSARHARSPRPVSRADRPRRGQLPLLEAPDLGDARAELWRAVEQGLPADGPAYVGLIGGLIAEQDRHPELIQAFRESVLLPRRAIVRSIVERGQARGEIRGDIEPDAALELMAGPFLARVFAGLDTGPRWRTAAFAKWWEILSERQAR
jgi:hypothetical protein